MQAESHSHDRTARGGLSMSTCSSALGGGLSLLAHTPQLPPHNSQVSQASQASLIFPFLSFKAADS